MQTPPLQISAGCTCCRRRRSTPPPAGGLLRAEASCLPSATAGPRSSAPPRGVSASWGRPEREETVRKRGRGTRNRLSDGAHLLQLAVLGGGHVQVGVGQAALREEVGHQRRPVRRILHHDPVQLRNVEEGLGQSGQFGLLHQPGRMKRKCFGVTKCGRSPQTITATLRMSV